MAKTCKFLSCKWPVWGEGYCKGHQYKRDDIKRFIKTKSNKRVNEDKEYKRICDEIDREAKNSGTYHCFFSGKPINGKAGHHHLRGRGKYFLDKEWIVLATEPYHSLKYHAFTVKELEKESWHVGFLERLKAKAPDLYEKEVEKKHK